jgi:hypothetical protein
MAENIKVKIEVDATSIKTATADSKQLEAALLKAGVPVEFMNDALDEVDKTLKEASVDAGKFAKALDSSATSTKSLRTQLAEAKNEAVKMSQQFGAFSKEAQTAAKRAAVIKDEIDDLNDTLNALNPEAKLNAFVKLGQGIQGGFQAATGALQLFGVENERITKLAQQFQGVLNLTEGINSVLQLKDVYGQLRLVLGVTTAAQNGLNVAMLANPAGALVVAIGALVAAVVILSDKTEEYALTEEQLNRIKQDGIDTTEDLKDAEDALAIQRDKNATFDIQRRKAVEKLEKDLFQLKLDQINAQDELNAAQESYNELGVGAARNLVIERQERLTNAIQLKQQTDEAVENKLKEFNATKELIRLKEQEAKADDNNKQKKKEAKTETDNYIASIRTLSIEIAKNNVEILKLSSEGFGNLQNVFNITEANAFDVKKAIEGINDELKNLEPVSVKISKTISDLNKEFFDKLDADEEERIKNAKLALSSASEVVEGIYGVTAGLRERELQDLEESRRKGLITEERYEAEVMKIKEKGARDQKKAALFAAILGGAQAIINALGTTPQAAIPAALALASITTAANIAKIVATPIPKFKQGTLNVGGGNVDADGGMHAIIHRGEAVIPADRNRDYHPTISALFKRQIKASDINSFVEMKLKGKSFERSHTPIDIDKLGRIITRDKNVNIGNAKVVGNIIADRLANKLDSRQW